MNWVLDQGGAWNRFMKEVVWFTQASRQSLSCKCGQKNRGCNGNDMRSAWAQAQSQVQVKTKSAYNQLRRSWSSTPIPKTVLFVWSHTPKLPSATPLILVSCLVLTCNQNCILLCIFQLGFDLQLPQMKSDKQNVKLLTTPSNTIQTVLHHFPKSKLNKD